MRNCEIFCARVNGYTDLQPGARISSFLLYKFHNFFQFFAVFNIVKMCCIWLRLARLYVCLSLCPCSNLHQCISVVMKFIHFIKDYYSMLKMVNIQLMFVYRDTQNIFDTLQTISEIFQGHFDDFMPFPIVTNSTETCYL